MQQFYAKLFAAAKLFPVASTVALHADISNFLSSDDSVHAPLQVLRRKPNLVAVGLLQQSCCVNSCYTLGDPVHQQISCKS